MNKTKFKTKRVTINLPAVLIDSSVKHTQSTITETIISALMLLKHRQAYDVAQKLKGNLHLKVDLSTSRER